MKKCVLLIFILLAALSACAENMVIDVKEAGVRPKASVNGAFVGTLTRGTEVEVTEINGRWATIRYKGQDRYIEAAFLAPSPRDIEAGNVEKWRIPGPNQTSAGDLGWYFSTDRIMETLPPIDILYGRLPFDVDRCFTVAVALLLVSWVAMSFFRSRIRYGNVWYCLCYAVSIIIAVCELLYVLGSGDPLGYCDINNVGFGKALLRVGLSALALYQQLILFSTIMFATQRDRDFNFGAGWAVKLMMLVVIYFIVCVFWRHFFYMSFPPYVSFIALGLLAIPIVAMVLRSIIEKDIATLVVILPFYVLMCAATLCIYCLIGISVAVLSFVLMLIMMFLNSDSYAVKYKGVWYYCDYDTWKVGYDLGLWETYIHN